MNFIENIVTAAQQTLSVISSFHWYDVIDILFVAFILYQGIKLIRETRAFQLAKGLVAVGMVYLIANVIGMKATSFIFSRLFADVLILLIVLFQPEIRHAIEHMGRRWRFLDLFLADDEEKTGEARKAIIEIAKACQRMSNSKTGSIIIMEDKTMLGDIIETGKVTDARITHELLGNIFFPNSPLHDGAAIVRDAKLYAAGCVLPLTDNPEIPSDLGMRHRAAIGVTEQSDAVAIITSEETGVISICYKGNIERGFDEASLRTRLFEFFEVDKTNTEKNRGLRKIKKILKGNKK
ncbi:MAG: diadenylate cyclase CdaA [Clostridia bacterium]|nr:diadenylate cyclase CdaA [Clostridia bacterium]